MGKSKGKSRRQPSGKASGKSSGKLVHALLDERGAIRREIDRMLVPPGTRVSLRRDYDPAWTARYSDKDEVEALPAGSYYHYQLKGLTVVDAAGAVVGRIEDLLETGAAVVLVVRDGARETLIPLADAFVQSVDLAASRMVVKMPETMNA